MRKIRFKNWRFGFAWLPVKTAQGNWLWLKRIMWEIKPDGTKEIWFDADPNTDSYPLNP